MTIEFKESGRGGMAGAPALEALLLPDEGVMMVDVAGEDGLVVVAVGVPIVADK